MGNTNSGSTTSSSGGTSSSFYTFHGDPRATFAEFFGTSNPFEIFFNLHSSPSGLGDSLFNDMDHDSLHAHHHHHDPFASLGARTPFRSQSFNVGGQSARMAGVS